MSCINQVSWFLVLGLQERDCIVIGSARFYGGVCLMSDKVDEDGQLVGSSIQRSSVVFRVRSQWVNFLLESGSVGSKSRRSGFR
jgi:hypothetical protein